MGCAAVFISIIGISGYLAHFFPVLDPEFINDWSTVISISFLLSAAAALIRDLKPVFSRFPRLFTFLPLLLILFYPLIMETLILKMWIIALYQGSAIIIGLLVYSYKTYINSQYGFILVGMIFFFITFVLYWLPQSIFSLPQYIWVLMTACGILIITVGYSTIYYNIEQNVRESVAQEDHEWFI